MQLRFNQPFPQDTWRHSLIFSSHREPLNPARQAQLKALILSTQNPSGKTIKPLNKNYILRNPVINATKRKEKYKSKWISISRELPWQATVHFVFVLPLFLLLTGILWIIGAIDVRQINIWRNRKKEQIQSQGPFTS